MGGAKEAGKRHRDARCAVFAARCLDHLEILAEVSPLPEASTDVPDRSLHQVSVTLATIRTLAVNGCLGGKTRDSAVQETPSVGKQADWNWARTIYSRLVSPRTMGWLINFRPQMAPVCISCSW